VPELPEVEIWRRRIWPTLSAATVTDVRGSPGPPLAPGLSISNLRGALIGRECVRVDRRGKRLALRFTETERALVIQLGMTGRFHVESSHGPEFRFERLRLELSHGAALVYADARRIGRLSWVAHGEAFQALGPDALATEPDEWSKRFTESRSPIKVALLDQERIAGVGNIYACEGLHAAGIHPQRPARTLTPAEWTHLALAIQASMQQTLSRDGEGSLLYLSANETKVNPFVVYGRAGEPCPTCAVTICRDILGGRGTFFCPACQPEAAAVA